MKITLKTKRPKNYSVIASDYLLFLLTIVARITENFEITNKIKHREFPSTDYLKFKESHPEVGDSSPPWVKPWHLHAVAVIIAVNGRESK